jgi:hypothetical protein
MAAGICTRGGQIVEARIGACFWHVKRVFFHKLIHSFCGYLVKR